MPADADFVEQVVTALQTRGAVVTEAPGGDGYVANPFPLGFVFSGNPYRVLVHVRRVTPQRGENTDHGRGTGEWHMQMIFDDSLRGSGVRNRLARRRSYTTVLFGYVMLGDVMVIAAWDAARRSEYAYSRGLQVKEATLIAAEHFGVGQQVSRGNETVVAFRAEYLPEYLVNIDALHTFVLSDEAAPGAMQASEELREGSGVTRRSLRDRSGARPASSPDVPPDFFGPRNRRPASGTRPVRDVRFKNFIAQHYLACAVCGLDASPVLEAAHVIPVSDEKSSDHPSNGLRLCRNCHALFDAGYLLLRPDYTVEVSPRLELDAPDTATAYGSPERGRLRLPAVREEYLPDPGKLAEMYERLRGLRSRE